MPSDFSMPSVTRFRGAGRIWLGAVGASWDGLAQAWTVKRADGGTGMHVMMTGDPRFPVNVTLRTSKTHAPAR